MLSGEEATMVVIEPRLSVMRGPNCLAMLWRVTWGWVPSWWRLPRMGKPVGPGGRFLVWDFLNKVRSRNKKRVMQKMKM